MNTPQHHIISNAPEADRGRAPPENLNSANIGKFFFKNELICTQFLLFVQSF
jgi:hypothetical protein